MCTCTYVCMCICVGIRMYICTCVHTYMLCFELAVCSNVLSCSVCQVWDYETIDNADITEDNTQFEMEPLTEIRVGTKVSIKSLVRSMDPDMSTMWYAQDAGGAIWKVDIIDSHTVSKVQCQHHAHALYVYYASAYCAHNIMCTRALVHSTYTVCTYLCVCRENRLRSYCNSLRELSEG